ncbi:MAG: hypothetical protein WBN66_01870, partial [Smithella sp.]
VYAMCIVTRTIYILKTLKIISTNYDIDNDLEKYDEMLRILSSQSDKSMKLFDYYNEYITAIGIAALQAQGFDVQVKRN